MSTNMTLIEAKTSTSSSVTFSSIPATYTDLKVVASIRSDRSGAESNLTLKFNSSTSGYSRRELYGNGASAASATASSASAFEYIYIPSASATSNTFNNIEIYIPNYASANYKSFSIDNAQENNQTTAYLQLEAGLWSNTTAIDSITLTEQYGSNFSSGSTFYLYGISNVTSTTKATGGIVSSDGTYNYHMFPYSGTFTPTQNITADYLVIAGGGGGGKLDGGGGGAGGLRSTVGATGGGGSLESALSLTANTAYTVTVGAGGGGSTDRSLRGSSGSNSVFGSITSTGGGGGGSHSTSLSQEAGGTGGSGGGTSHNNSSIAGGARTASPVQGFDGGSGYAGGSGINAGGGGGGAGETGNTDGKSEGGDGVAISAFANATQTGVNTYYAGGGGGGMENGIGGPEGLGGGGHGSYNDSGAGGTAGITNTGGGGGGGGYSSSGGNGFAGGSGLVIIRYAI